MTRSIRKFIEDLNEPELAAERKKKEAEAAEAARQESLTIHSGLAPSPYLNLQAGSTAPLWRDATLTEAERAEAEKVAEEERTGMRQIPDPL